MRADLAGGGGGLSETSWERTGTARKQHRSLSFVRSRPGAVMHAMQLLGGGRFGAGGNPAPDQPALASRRRLLHPQRLRMPLAASPPRVGEEKIVCGLERMAGPGSRCDGRLGDGVD